MTSRNSGNKRKSFRRDKSKSGCGGLLGLVLIVGAIALFASCGGDNESTTPTAPATTEQLTWQESRPDDLKRIIDEDAANSDCDALQETFDVWDNADDPTQTKGALLAYIDDAMSDAGCYDK